MRVRILDPAERDLENGYRFYERQSSGLGSYFLDSLYADIDSLAYFGGIHRVVSGSIGFFPNGFRSPCIMKLLRMGSW